jgi:hypothetical protein
MPACCRRASLRGEADARTSFERAAGFDTSEDDATFLSTLRDFH